jgi:hypothetical protein
MQRPSEEFYVGYHPVAPAGIARRIRVVIVAAVVVVLTLAGILALGQRRLPLATFEYGMVRSFHGRLRTAPYPILLVPRRGATPLAVAVSQYLLSAQGKHGAGYEVAGLDGSDVTLRGTLAFRDDQTMIEVQHGSVAPAVAPLSPLRLAEVEDLGVQTLDGEIVDSKCFLGVMNPGDLKPHRTCAARCISGGIPPTFVVRDAAGVAAYYLLVGAGGDPLRREVLPFVAEPIAITGRVTREGDRLMISADPATFRRLE